jgi:hypothetical protein
MPDAIFESIDLVAKFCNALERNGWTREMLDDFANGKDERLRRMRDVYLGRSHIAPTRYFINLNAEPLPLLQPIHARVKKHTPHGEGTWLWEDFALLSGTGLEKEPRTLAYVLEELRSFRRKWCNATLLDFCLEKPTLPADEWMDGRTIFFPGTSYGVEGNEEDWVRYMRYDSRRRVLYSHIMRVNEQLPPNAYVACLALA